MQCTLCQSYSRLCEFNAYQCDRCGLVFKNPEEHISIEEEASRYQFHQNSSQDQGYINFLNKLIIPLKEFLPQSFKTLDFGCGPGPTISSMLAELGGETFNYDPQFYPEYSLLKPDYYDVVTCTEVVEHFKNPEESWELLMSLAKKQGLVAIMTQFYRHEVNYQQWWYKNDPTHVAFYQNETFIFLAQKYNLDVLYNDNKSIIIFRKRGS